MQRLVELDSVKTRMQDTQQALQVQCMLIDIISLLISFHFSSYLFPFFFLLRSLFPPSLTQFLFHLSLSFLSPPLQEADNWATLVTDVEEVFDTRDIGQISEKVIRMQQSLV